MPAKTWNRINASVHTIFDEMDSLGEVSTFLMVMAVYTSDAKPPILAHNKALFSCWIDKKYKPRIPDAKKMNKVTFSSVVMDWDIGYYSA